MVESRHAVEQGVLFLAQERRHGEPVEDHGSRQGRVRRIEGVVLDLDGGPGKSPSLERAEQRFEPLRVFVEHGEVGQRNSAPGALGGGCRRVSDQIIHNATLGIPEDALAARSARRHVKTYLHVVFSISHEGLILLNNKYTHM